MILFTMICTFAIIFRGYHIVPLGDITVPLSYNFSYFWKHEIWESRMSIKTHVADKQRMHFNYCLIHNCPHFQQLCLDFSQSKNLKVRAESPQPFSAGCWITQECLLSTLFLNYPWKEDKARNRKEEIRRKGAGNSRLRITLWLSLLKIKRNKQTKKKKLRASIVYQLWP